MVKYGLTASALLIAMLAPPAFAADSTVPDFSGMWGRNSFDAERLPAGPAPLTNLKRLNDGTIDINALVGDYKNPILKPAAAEAVRKRGEYSLTGDAFPDPSNHCAPYSPPYIYSRQLGLQLIQGKGEVTILYNQDDQVRRVRLNAAHPRHVTPSAMGDSIGHYENDTLVVDTIGVKVGPLTMADGYGSPQSENLHLVERYRLLDAAAVKDAATRHEKANGRVGGAAGAMPVDASYAKGLRIEFTVEDAANFTTPWSAQVNYLRTTTPWLEQVCAENHFEYYHGKPTAIPTADRPDF
jgi:hypothetical protein